MECMILFCCTSNAIQFFYFLFMDINFCLKQKCILTYLTVYKVNAIKKDMIKWAHVACYQHVWCTSMFDWPTDWSCQRVWWIAQKGSRESEGHEVWGVSIRVDFVIMWWVLNQSTVYCICLGLCVIRYKIRGDDEEWDQVLKNAGSTGVVSIKRWGLLRI